MEGEVRDSHGRFSKGGKVTFSEEHKKNMGLAQKGKEKSENAKKRIGLAHKGRKASLKTKSKMSLSHKQWSENNPMWNKGTVWTEARRKAQPPRKPRKYTSRGKVYSENWCELRKEIYERDSWHCRECGIKNTLLGKSKIQCHHIDFDITNNQNKNLITLCASCHAKTNFRRKNWIEYYQNKMEGFNL